MNVPGHVHFMGMGGIGMSAIAQVLMASGTVVSGCDLRASELTDRMRARGAVFFERHSPEHMRDVTLLVYSSAVPADHPELVEAQRRGIETIKRAEMLARLFNGRRSIAVAGTHGKTTTSTLIGFLLERAGYDPTLLLGGESVDLGSNARLGAGDLVVAEADEFDGSFLRLKPYLAVLTNIEADHLDFYGSYDRLFAAFIRFLASVSPEGRIVACLDDPAVASAVGQRDIRAIIDRYGLHPDAAWRAIDVELVGATSSFRAEHNGVSLGTFEILLPGLHNVRNALAAIATVVPMGVDQATLREGLAVFRGAKRRFEIKGELGGVLVIDDYGHHPTEVAATLAAARGRLSGRRIVCVFQPHTYSRTKNLLDEFAACFHDADELVVTEIYAAREKDTLGVSSADLVSRVKQPAASLIPSLEEAANYLSAQLGPGDVLVTMGAGDVYRVGEMVLARLKGRGKSSNA